MRPPGRCLGLPSCHEMSFALRSVCLDPTTGLAKKKKKTVCTTKSLNKILTLKKKKKSKMYMREKNRDVKENEISVFPFAINNLFLKHWQNSRQAFLHNQPLLSIFYYYYAIDLSFLSFHLTHMHPSSFFALNGHCHVTNKHSSHPSMQMYCHLL